MFYSSVIIAFIMVLILSAVGTALLDIIFRFLGKRGYLGNLYPNVRGGTPRGIGLVPFLILSFFMLPGCNILILIIGIFAFIDDVIGRRKCEPLGIEWGQLSRGIGIILIIIVGIIEGYWISAVFIALMVQPLNISAMQPGSTCLVTLIMSIVTIIFMLIFKIRIINHNTPHLLIIILYFFLFVNILDDIRIFYSFF